MHRKWLSKRGKRMRIADLPFAYCILTIHILFSPFQEDAVELCLLRFLRGEVNFLHRQIRAKKNLPSRDDRERRF